MGPALGLMCCFVLVVLVPPILFVLTYVFRLACVLCGLPKPSLLLASAVLGLNLIGDVIAETVLTEGVRASAPAAGFPNWETGLIVFFLALPIDLALSSALHAGLLRVPVGKGVEVWFVQRLIYLGLAAAALAVTAVVYLIKQN